MPFMQEMLDTCYFSEGVKGWFSGSHEDIPAGLGPYPTLALFLSLRPISPGQVSPAFSENLQQPYGWPAAWRVRDVPPTPLFLALAPGRFSFQGGLSLLSPGFTS